MVSKGMLRGRQSAGKGLEVSKYEVCSQIRKFSCNTENRRKAVENRQNLLVGGA